MNRKHILATAIVTLLVAPAASATWYSHGSYEPDTARDASDGFMFTLPDTSAGQGRVYFNGVQNVQQTGVNPNVAETGSSIRATPAQTMSAYLGVWKDCNGDQYIGSAAGALAEYPSSLLVTGDSICPEGSEWNKDGWVYEFLWIGHSDSVRNETAYENFGVRRLINDTQARVWADYGLPDGAAPRGSCAVNPLPAGTTASTGGLIAYTDCIAGRQITGAANAVDPDCSLNLCIQGDPQRSGSLLNQHLPVHPFYDPYSSGSDQTGLLEDAAAKEGKQKDSAFQVFDCDSTERVAVSDPTGNGGRGELSAIADPTDGELSGRQPTDAPVGVTVFNGTTKQMNLANDDGEYFGTTIGTVSPAVLNPTGSYQDAINDTERGAVWECESDANTFVGGDFGVEASYGGVSAQKGRMQTDIYFNWQEPSKVLNPAAFNGFNACVFEDDEDFGDVPEGCQDMYVIPEDTISSEIPWDGGVALGRFAITQGPRWSGLPNYIRTPQSVSRADLQPEGADYMTLYAHVGTEVRIAYAVPSSVVGTYGDAWCAGATTGIVNGWDCDASHWWNPTYDPANTAMPTQGRTGRDLGVKTGQAYHLRDIDCYDGELVRGVPVYASLVQLDPRVGPCERPA